MERGHKKDSLDSGRADQSDVLKDPDPEQRVAVAKIPVSVNSL
jgi:hypothetical protein